MKYFMMDCRIRQQTLLKQKDVKRKEYPFDTVLLYFLSLLETRSFAKDIFYFLGKRKLTILYVTSPIYETSIIKDFLQIHFKSKE